MESGVRRCRLLGNLLVVITGLSIIAAGVRALAWSGSEMTSPFDSYADVFPGQPHRALEARGLSCSISEDENSHDSNFANAVCVLPATSAFSSVNVVLEQDSIRQIVFTMRENTLKVGDLMVLWGRPEVRTYSRIVFLYWRSRHIFVLANTNTGRFSVHLPVWRVYYTSYDR